MKKVNLYCLLISVLCLIFIWGCGQGAYNGGIFDIDVL